MKISEIYREYKIMPQLQLHMLRVAGVASIIVENFEENLDKDSIIIACLLHDIGNIVKFDLTRFPEHLEPEGLDYWESIKSDFIKKYNKDEHKATIKIAKELDIDEKMINLVQNLEFSDSLKIAGSDNIERKIIKYSDLRVAPYGVNSLENRLKEAKKRYVDEKQKWTEEEFNKLTSVWEEVEKQIFAKCKINPAVITEEKVKPLIDKLRSFEIS